MLTADRAARTATLFVARPDLGTLVVSGADRLSWLQGVVTCDVADLPLGEGRWGLVLTKPGKILADAVVVPADERVLLGVPARESGALLDWLGRFLIMEDAEIVDASDDVAWVTLHGPLSSEVARALAGPVGGHAAAVDFTGLGGAAVAVPRRNAKELADAAALDPRVVVATEDDWQRLRVERLVPLYGVDVGAEQNPHEASLDRRAVSWTKGCYLGQEAVCMQDMRGRVKRRLALVLLEGVGDLPGPGTEVTDREGARIGQTRSAVLSAALGGPAVLALVMADRASPGTELSIGGRKAHVMAPDR